MTAIKASTIGKLVPMPRVKPSQRESEKKWGKKVMALGFCVVPSLLLRAQRRLGLNPTQLAVLIQLCDFWWKSGENPYPSKKTLGQRLSLSPRQVQRYIADLEKAGLVKRIERRSRHGGKRTNFYDLSGLVNRLNDLEPDFRDVKNKIKAARKQVARPGYRQRLRNNIDSRKS